MAFPRIMTLASAIAGLVVSAAYAYDTPEPNLSRPLGTLQEQRLWTAEDVKSLCEARFSGQKRPIQTCIERNQRKIGRVVNLGDQQELQSRGVGETTTATTDNVPKSAASMDAAGVAGQAKDAVTRANPNAKSKNK